MLQERFDAVLDSWKAWLQSVLAPLSEGLSFLSDFWVSLGLIGIIFLLMVIVCISCGHGSIKEKLKNPRVLTVCAMMMALNIILGYFAIRFTAYLRIGFGFITQPVVGMLFGPFICALTGMVQDVISLMLNPTGAYLPAYTLSVGISGIFYGLILYQKPVKLWRVFVAKLLVILIGNIVLNSIALATTVSSGFVGILPSRILKNIVLLPIETVVSYLVLKFMQKQKLLKIFDR